MSNVFDWSIRGLSFVDLGIGLLLVFIGLGSGRLAQLVLAKLLDRTTPHTLRHAVLDSIILPITWTLRLIGVWGALTYLPLGSIDAFDLHRFVTNLFQASTIGLATWVGVRMVSNLAGLWAYRATRTEGTFDDQLVPIMRSSGRVFLILTGSVMVLQNLGYSVSSLLAGLGIGGAAIAFASKDAIANVFGSLVIFIDRPFQVGDWVQIGDVEGTVESVRLRSTSVRTFANSVITLPNSQMTTTAIQNWSRMRKRRLKLDVGVTYDTTPEQLEAAVGAIREIIANDDRFDHEVYMVSFNALGDSSLNIFVYAFTKTTEWTEHMEVQQEFLLAVLRALNGLHVAVAFPTRTLHLAGGSMPSPAQPDRLRGLVAPMRPGAR